MATVIGERSASLRLGTVLSRAGQAVRSAPALFFGIGFLLAALPAAMFQLMVLGAGEAGVALSIAFGLGWFVLYLAAQALMMRAAVDRLDDRAEPLRALVEVAAKTALPLLATSLLYGLAVLLGWFALLVPGVIVATMWSLATVVVVAERAGPITAFGRSRALTSGSRWRIFGLFLLVGIFYLLCYAVLGLVRTTVFGLSAVDTGASVGGVIFSAALNTVGLPIWCAIQAALYVELRDAKDGPAGDRLADIFA
ncbi:hypothetical protein K7957_11420 [Sphingomonas yunnanensis]|uniref:hypothetical protein n=1 Tax=Sphingomonas yunnanensis TaxID=310400 RepID=UPI001CA76477|nr:hypothetical protein [Sphingomonas yunnanensis]MBY9063541.1 hypothetical protein [Sphingomonas yunnanensis]